MMRKLVRKSVTMWVAWTALVAAGIAATMALPPNAVSHLPISSSSSSPSPIPTSSTHMTPTPSPHPSPQGTPSLASVPTVVPTVVPSILPSLLPSIIPTTLPPLPPIPTPSPPVCLKPVHVGNCKAGCAHGVKRRCRVGWHRREGG